MLDRGNEVTEKPDDNTSHPRHVLPDTPSAIRVARRIDPGRHLDDLCYVPPASDARQGWDFMGRVHAVFAAFFVTTLGAVAMPPLAGALIAPTSPVLVSLAAQPGSVNVTSNPGSVAVTIHATDSNSSIDTFSTSFSFSCGCGGSIDSSGSTVHVVGTPHNGWFTYTVTVPSSTPVGTYTLSTLTLNDTADNAITYPTTPWPAGVNPPSFTVTKTPDVIAPAVGAISFNPTVLDVTQANKNAAVDVHLSDAVPGVDHGTITVTNGTVSNQLAFDNTNRTSGTALNGVYEVTFPVDYTTTGTYRVSAIDAFDGYGNENSDTSPGGGVVSVTATGDTTAPNFGVVSVSPNAVDTTAADRTVTVTAHITDNVSGFASGEAQFSDGAGGSTFGFFDTTNLVSGTVTNGTYSFPVTFPVASETGDYTLSLLLTDFQGNSPDDFVPVNEAQTDVNVTTTADPTGPQVTSFSLSPSSVNLVRGFGSAYAHITVTDNGSALQSGIVNLTAPDNSPVQAFFSPQTGGGLVSGTAQSGTYLVALPVNQTGSYTAASVELTSVQNVTNTPAENGSVQVVEQAGDNEAPTLGAITLQPPSGDTTNGPVTVTATIPVTDPAPQGVTPTGFTSGTVTLRSPTGNTTAQAFLSPASLVNGDDHSGTYQAQFQVPQWSEKGSWTVSDVTLMDNASNFHHYTGAELTGITGTPTVSIAGPIDIKPPTVTSIAPSPASIDTSTGPQSVSFDIGVADDLSGFAFGTVTLTSPDGNDFATGDLNGPTSGTGLSGHFAATVELPQYGQSGSWTISLELTDNSGNDRTYQSADLIAAGLPGTYSVTTAPDSAAPQAASVSFDPTSVDTTGGAADVLVNARLTDNASGVDGAELVLTSPNGQQEVDASLQLVGGNNLDGYWQGGLHFGQYLPSGSWKIELDLFDVAGNEADLTSSALANAGLPTTYTVTGASDTTPPAPTSISVSPSSLDVRAQQQPVTVTIGLSDAQSGFLSGSFVIVPQSGLSQPIMGFFAGSPVSGTSNSGTWQAQVNVPQFVASGTWRVDSLDVTDNANNEHLYHTADLAALPGAVTTFTVQSTPDTTPPTLTGASFAPNPTDVSAGSQSVTASVTVNDAGSGVGSIFMTVAPPNGSPESPIFVGPFALNSGTAGSGTWTASFNVPRYAAPGAWSISSVTASDNAENVARYGTGGSALPAYTPLQVNDANPDTVAPAVNAIQITPPSVDVSTGEKDVTLDFSVTDARSGATSVGYTVSSPSGSQTMSGTINSLFSGTPQSGHWDVVVPIGTHAESGTWKVTQVSATDAIGNTVTVTSPNVPATNTFNVTGTVVSAPSAPTSVFATAGNKSATVTWATPADNGGAPVTGYAVTVGANAPVNVDANTFSYHASGLTNGTPVTFQVQAINSAGPGPAATSNTVTPEPTVPAVPATPTVQNGPGQVTLNWSAPADDGGSPITGYDISISPVPPGGSPIHVGAVDTSSTITGLTNGTTYTFALQADNAIGPSGYSLPVIQPRVGGLITGLSLTPSIPSVGADHHAVVNLKASWSAGSVPESASGVRACLQPTSAVQPTWSACTGGTVLDVAPGGSSASFASLAAGRGYRVTVWPSFSSPAAGGTATTASIVGSSFSNGKLAKIVDGATINLSTKLLVSGTSTVLGRQPVTLWQQPAGAKTWTQVAATTTNTSGAAVHAVKPAVNTTYQWRYAGTGAHMSSAGGETVDVAFAVAEHATTLHLRLGSTMYLYGTVAPLPKNQWVYLQKSNVTQSTKAQIVHQKLPNGVTTWGFKLAFRPGARGTYSIRIYIAASKQNTAGYGATVKLVVS